jgi:hypothetical protein
VESEYPIAKPNKKKTNYIDTIKAFDNQPYCTMCEKCEDSVLKR